MSTRRNQGTRRLAAASVLSALGVLLLALGAFVEVLDLSMAALASLLVVLAVIELGGKYPYLIYAVTAVLGLLLLPNKTPAVLYTLFAGFYPIVKAGLERKLSRVLAWVLKLVIFNACLALAAFVAVKLVLPDAALILSYWWLLPIVGTPIFVIYDIALTRLISTYIQRWRTRLRFFQD